MALPSNVSYTLVTGRFLQAVGDSTSDADRFPDGIPLTGMKIKFTASVAVAKNPTATPPVTVFFQPIEVTTNDDGDLVDVNGQTGVYLVSTNDPDLIPTNFTYNVYIKAPVNSGIADISFNISAPSGGTIDLTTTVPVTSNPGQTLSDWLNAVSRTESARDAAIAAKNAAVAVGGTNDDQTANNINTDGSKSQKAVDDRTAKALSVYPDVIGAAASAAITAVTSEIANRLLSETYLLPPNNADDLGIALPFADGSRNALEVDTKGRPTPLSAQLHVEAEHVLMGEALGFEVRTDIALLNVRALFAFEDDSIAGYIYNDGTVYWVKNGVSPETLAFTAWGDSTTYGSELSTPTVDRWAARLSNLIGQMIEVHGMPGSRSGATSVWTGGRSNSGLVNGGTIPSTGYAEIGSMTTGLWASDVAATDFDVIAITDNGTRLEGTLGRSPSGGAWYRFTRKDQGGPAITTVRLEMQAALNTTKYMLLGIGRNDIPYLVSGAMTPQQFMQNLEEIIGHWDGEVLYWGFTDTGYVERPGTVAGDIITDLEKRIQEKYGSRFLPLRAYLSSAQALTDAKIFQPGFQPTADDNMAVSVGRTPPSFRAASTDSPHLNVLGHQLQARFFHRNLIIRGIV